MSRGPVIKLLTMVKKRADLTREQFRDSWLDSHVRIGKRLAEASPVRRIAVSFTTGELLGGQEPIFDGMAEYYFDTAQDLTAASASPASELLRQDEPRSIDLSGGIPRIVTEEYVTAEAPSWAAMGETTAASRTKIVRAVKRRDDLTRDQFKHYWLTRHAQLEQTRVQASLVRRIAATFLTGRVVDGTEPSFDGMVSLYFDSVEAAREQFASGSGAIMRKDEENFVDLAYPVVRMVAHEYIAAP